MALGAGLSAVERRPRRVQLLNDAVPVLGLKVQRAGKPTTGHQCQRLDCHCGTSRLGAQLRRGGLVGGKLGVELRAQLSHIGPPP
jgi:hypothetical protein